MVVMVMVWDGESDHDYDRGEDGDHDEEKPKPFPCMSPRWIEAIMFRPGVPGALRGAGADETPDSA